MSKEERFEKNQSLVYFVVNERFPGFRTNEDVIQDGMLGLWKACLSFSEERGIKFSTFAYRCIFNEINMGFRSIKKSNLQNLVSLDEIPQGVVDSSNVCEKMNYWRNLSEEEAKFVEKISRGDCDLLKTYGRKKLRKLKSEVQKKMDKESLI